MEKLKSFHWRTRTAVLIILLTGLILIYSVAGLQLYKQQRLTITSAQTENLDAARSLASYVAHIVRTTQLVQDHVIEKMEEHGMQYMKTSKGFDYLQRFTRRTPEIATLSVYDGAGNLVANSQSASTTKINVADREYFIQHKDGANFFVGAPIISRITGEEVFTISRAMRDKEGLLAAVVLISIKRAYIEKVFKERQSTDTVTLIREDGLILVRSPQVAIGEKLPSTARIFTSIKQSPTGNYESFSPLDGKQRLFGYGKTEGFPLLLMVSSVKSEVLSPWYEDVFRIALILLTSSIVLVTGGLMILRTLGREEEAHEQLKKNEQFRHDVLDSVSAHVAILKSDATILSTNKSWQDYSIQNGYEGVPDMVGKNYFAACREANNDDANQVIAGISGVIMGSLPEFHQEYDCSSPTERRWFKMTVRPLLGNKGSVLVSHEDVTRQKEVEMLLRDLAQTDPLTGIANRRRFFESASTEFLLSCRHNRSLSLLMVDCDHFKNINDTYGHETGDTVLVAVATAMKQNVRTTDLVARAGGEEFMALLPETPLQSALIVAEQIRAAIAALPFESSIGSFSVTASIGVASYTADICDFSTLAQIADTRMYAAKQKGRNRVES